MISETDLELLEAYLDDALSDRELATVAGRLASEPELAAELEKLRAERELRRAVWATLEPRDAEVEHLLGRIDEGIRRRSWWERQVKWARWGVAAAACIVFGFATGYLGRGPHPGNLAGNNNGAPVEQVAENTGNPGNPGNQPGIQFVGKVHQPYQVQLTDDSGKLIAVQPFDSLDKAKAFADDVQNWQEHQRQMQSGNVVLTGGHF